MNLNYYKNLCVKSLRENISHEDEIKLNKWLDESENNRIVMKEIKQIWNKFEDKRNFHEPNKDLEWAEIKKKISRNNEKESFAKRVYNVIDSYKKPAIGFSFAVILMFAFIMYNSTSKQKIAWETFATLNNEHKELELSDGSKVYLNYASEIRFRKGLGGEDREIFLRGEAYFDVEKDGRKFVVITNNAMTTVLGTEFNVKARNNKTEVAVAKGLVNLKSGVLQKEGVYITPNHISSVVENNPASNPEDVEVENIIAWRENKLVFEKELLGNAIEEIERFYNEKIVIENNKLLTKTFTGQFQDNSIDQVLEMISITLSFKIEKKSDGYHIK